VGRFGLYRILLWSSCSELWSSSGRFWAFTNILKGWCIVFVMGFIKLCNDEVLADHPVGNLVIKKSGDFCYRDKSKLCNDEVLADQKPGSFC